jgi:hypothetical protein
VFVPIVVVLSFGTLSMWLIIGVSFAEAFEKAIAVMVIACPCGMGLAVPTAVMVGSGNGAKHGVLIKGADIMDKARKGHSAFGCCADDCVVCCSAVLFCFVVLTLTVAQCRRCCSIRLEH